MSADHSPFTDFDEQPGTAVERYGARDFVEGSAIELTETPVSAPSFAQGISVVADGSVSMQDTIKETGEQLAGMPPRSKAQAATVAIGDMVSRLQAGRRGANFSFGYVAFNERVTVDRPIVPLLELPATDDFDPTQAGSGGTCISAGLEAAYDQIVRWRSGLSGSLHVSNVVLAMTDGLDSGPARTLAAAARLKELPEVTLAACLFTAVGDPVQGGQLMQQIATSPRFYKTVFSAEQLREFFLASITLAQGPVAAR